MFEDPKGPIEHYSWGKFIILGKTHSSNYLKTGGAGKDIILIGTKASPWKERKGHKLPKETVNELFGKGIEVLVIGNGAYGALECPNEVIEYIKENGIPKVIIQKTQEACKTYNKLYHEGKRVALIAHGTC